MIFFLYIIILFREGLKKRKKNMENSILGGEGGEQRGSFSISNFFLFFAANGLTISFRH